MNNTKIFLDGLEKLIAYKKQQKKLTDWFTYQEIKMNVREQIRNDGGNPDAPENQAEILCKCIEQMPLSIPIGSVLAGSQDAAFSPSYALINPNFQVETFAGYCDPLAIYDDMAEDDEFTKARIEKLRAYWAGTDYVKNLKKIYDAAGTVTGEVACFIEPVTGHTIPDMRPLIRHGAKALSVTPDNQSSYSAVMKAALQAPAILARRYAELAGRLMLERADDAEEAARLRLIKENCERVPAQGAENLHEAVQAFALLWQVMCLEQAPNPYALSVGNLDRVLMPWLKDTGHETAVALVRHLLAFFMVGDRCWAISHNILTGGRDENRRDLTNEMTYIVLDAFYESNMPQPALSVRLHKQSPDELYQSLGRFFFTPGHSTPSLFNDESMFKVLANKGVELEDRKDYAIAGCQEPLIMGRENANTTNSWLNLAKILELALNDGKSMLSGNKIGLSWEETGCRNATEAYENIETLFWKQFDYITEKMRDAANACTENLGTQAVPFSSALHGCLDSGRDMRNAKYPGTKYNGSGCLIHGLSVVADSFHALKKYLEFGIDSADELRSALVADYKGYDKIKSFLSGQDKYGNNIPQIDRNVADLSAAVCRKVAALKNSAGQSFAPDFSTPSTHLLYGYWVGATPDGRNAREMLGYGVDPRPGMAHCGLQERILSARHLPFLQMTGGYASHIGLAPDDFSDAATFEEKACLMRKRIITPLFGFNSDTPNGNPFYVYFNVDETSHLHKVLENPEKYAPSGIYIMRIHGTFVNFLDLSPAVQRDIIERLESKPAPCNN
jgi:formate C-acetyltransferase